MTKIPFGFIGAGAMGGALINGMIAAKKAAPNQIAACDLDRERMQQLTSKGVVGLTMADLIRQCEVVFVCVKPNVVGAILDDVGAATQRPRLVVSIAAGVQIAFMESRLPPGTKVIRVMPNTPCLVGESAAGYSGGTHATMEDLNMIGDILSAVGIAVRVAEKDLDAVTGLSASGPAFVYLMIEALSDGGVRAGLTREVANKLAAQTVRGAASMVIETGKHPGELKDQVCSPGGTTIAGVEHLERSGFRAAAMGAVTAAANRARELSKL